MDPKENQAESTQEVDLGYACGGDNSYCTVYCADHATCPFATTW